VTPAEPEATRACPSCGVAMRRQAFARKLEGSVDLDICFDCQAIWFDPLESSALAPRAVIDLFRLIHEHANSPPRLLAEGVRCPVCRRRLQLTQDIERTNRISYYRCTEGHGRLTTFVQFLREKNFVRSLTPAEIERLKVTVAQVRCSSCGAPVDIGRDPVCAYCHAPIAILDAQAVTRALAELDDADKQRHSVDPAAAVEALLAGKRYVPGLDRNLIPTSRGPDAVDLVSEALDFLMHRT
jgi:hypothetical protein